MVVLSKEVVGGLAKVLYIRACTHTDRISEKMKWKTETKKKKGVVHGPSRMGERVEGETFVLSRGEKRDWNEKKVREDLCGGRRGNGQETDKRVGLFLFGCSARGNHTLGMALERTWLGRNSERGTSENDAYDIGLSHSAILLHCTSPTHVYKVHFSGCTPIIKLYILRNNSDGASLFSGTL